MRRFRLTEYGKGVLTTLAVALGLIAWGTMEIVTRHAESSTGAYRMNQAAADGLPAVVSGALLCLSGAVLLALLGLFVRRKTER